MLQRQARENYQNLPEEEQKTESANIFANDIGNERSKEVKIQDLKI